MNFINLFRALKSITNLSTRNLFICIALTPGAIIIILIGSLIISVGGGPLEVIFGIILTLVLLCIIAFGYISMGIGTTDGSNVDIFEFLGQRPNASRYLLTTDPPNPDEEVPVDATFDVFSLLRPRVVKGLYFSLVGFHQKVASVDTTQRTLEYISSPDEEIDLPEAVISGLDISSKPALKSVRGRVPYRVINPVQTFYNVNTSLGTGPNSPGYLVELSKLFDEAVREAIGKSTLSLDEILSQSYKLSHSVTQILKYKVLSTNMGIWVGNVTISNADPSDAILKARESSSIEAELGKAELQKVRFRQRAIAMLMGLNEDGSENKKIPEKMRLTREEAINQENLNKLIESGLIKEMNLNSFGSGVLETIQGIINKRRNS